MTDHAPPTFLILALLGASGCTAASDPAGALADADGNYTGDVEPHDHPVEVDLASWVQSADDFIEGTVVEIRASWSPLVDRMTYEQTGPISFADCVEGEPILDLVLTDLRRIKNGSSSSTITVRVPSNSGLNGFSVPDVAWGATEVQGWHGPQPTFVEGMRVGGPIYYNPGHADPVFPTATRGSIYRVIDGSVEFMLPWMVFGTPYELPKVDHLQGVDPEGLWLQVVQAAQAPLAPLAAEYRARWGFDELDATEHYASFCIVRADQAGRPAMTPEMSARTAAEADRTPPPLSGRHVGGVPQLQWITGPRAAPIGASARATRRAFAPRPASRRARRPRAGRAPLRLGPTAAR